MVYYYKMYLHKEDEKVTEPVNAFDLLEWLREKNGKQVQNFKDLAGYLGFKAREKGVPVVGQFELTPLCCFDCKMCYVHLVKEQMNGRAVLPVGTWKDLIHQAWEAGLLEATLTGGECLTYPGFEELYLYLHSLGCEVAVLTNGFLLDEQRIQFFRDHMPVRIQITLYGWNEDVYERVTGHRAFHIVAENIRKAVKAGLPVSLNVTPSVFLGEDVLETIRTAKEICPSVSVNSAIFPPRDETGRSGLSADPGTDLYVQAYRLLEQLNGKNPVEISEEKLPPAGGPIHEWTECGLRCGGGRSGYVVNWQGVMMPCNRMEMIRAYPLRDGFPDAWASINRKAENWPRVSECEECVYHDVCNNCAGNAMLYAEPGKLPVKLCEQTKYFVRHGIRSIPGCE